MLGNSLPWNWLGGEEAGAGRWGGLWIDTAWVWVEQAGRRVNLDLWILGRTWLVRRWLISRGQPALPCPHHHLCLPPWCPMASGRSAQPGCFGDHDCWTGAVFGGLVFIYNPWTGEAPIFGCSSSLAGFGKPTLYQLVYCVPLWYFHIIVDRVLIGSEKFCDPGK